MVKTNLGRVQGGSIYTCSTESSVNVSKEALSPKDISPMIGDSVLFSNGDVRKIIDAEENFFTCSDAEINLKGVAGDNGVNIVDISAGSVINEGDYTVTPINFLLSDGNTISTNAKAKMGLSTTMTYDSTTKTLTITRG